MKLITFLALSLTATVAISARATLISQWTFEISVPTSGGPLPPEVGTGSASANHVLTSTAFSNPSGNGSGESWSANNWKVGDYWQFQVCTLGFKDIKVTFDQTSSSTGPGKFKFCYSTDLGMTFSSSPEYTVSAGSTLWNSSTYSPLYSFVFDLGAISDVADCASVLFRIEDTSTSAANSANPVATSGTSRVDNFTITGEQVVNTPDPGSSAILLGIPLAGLFAIRCRGRRPF